MLTEWLLDGDRQPCCDGYERKSMHVPWEMILCPSWPTLMYKPLISLCRTQIRKETEGIVKASATKH